MPHYAHSGDLDESEWHSLRQHLIETGERAARFLEPAGCGELARTAGLLHDLGKYSREFQSRLRGGPHCDHSTAGARVAIERYGNGDGRRASPGKMLAFAIAGHHAGLADGASGTEPRALADRLQADIPEVAPVWKQELSLPELASLPLKPRNKEMRGFCAAFATRMVFSALVDADFLDTEAWHSGCGGHPVPRGRHPPLAELLDRLDDHLNALMSNAGDTEINRLRREVLERTRARAAEAPGPFTFTVPTGGGKTLASLAFALEHAVHHGLARIIYVIPYTSIIDQTARVFREAIGAGGGDPADFIVEHHSAFEEDRVRNREAQDKLRLAMENWDAPIVVTTAVQFFESLFANRPSRCRKLHNIANSVVILDEAQSLPLGLLRPCVAALDELTRNWKASVVLCTATQPALGEEDGFVGGLEGLREIAPGPADLHRRLKRVTICQRGKVTDVELAECLREAQQVLCIVNTRRHAHELFDAIRNENEDGSLHLSTLMCARHRGEVLETVRCRLAKCMPVRLVATSLIEAGVDVDFPIVWRAEAGLESIVQAAGRCNREGRAEIGEVFVFEPADEEGRRPPGDVAKMADAARNVMRHHDDPSSPEAIRSYFRQIYWIEDTELDRKDILRKFRERTTRFDFPFATVAREFRMIEKGMVPIIVPYRGTNGDDETADRWLRQLGHVERLGRVARGLQPYTVQVPPRRRRKLLDAGAVRFVREDVFGEQFALLENLDLYRPDIGLAWEDPAFRAAEGLIV